MYLPGVVFLLLLRYIPSSGDPDPIISPESLSVGYDSEIVDGGIDLFIFTF